MAGEVCTSRCFRWSTDSLGAVFGYFETLLRIGDLQLIMQEEIRLQTFADTMRMAGIDYDIIIDMFDFTWELFNDLKKAVESGQTSESVLLESLNDEIKSNSIIYHFKVGTAPIRSTIRSHTST